jgi:hypothetical protein
MGVNLAELLALPSEERLKLAETLMESAAPADLEPLLKEFVLGMERTNRAVEAALERLSRMDDTLERNRAEVREAVRRSRDVWPLPLPPG